MIDNLTKSKTKKTNENIFISLFNFEYLKHIDIPLDNDNIDSFKTSPLVFIFNV